MSADRPSERDALVPIVRGRLVPTAWGVECPWCGGVIEIEHVGEDDAGLFYADEIDTAPDCPTCAVCVASARVEIREHDQSATASPDAINIARAIYAARFAHEKPRDLLHKTFDDLPDDAKAIWLRCAQAALDLVASTK